MQRYENIIDAIENARNKAFKREDGTTIIVCDNDHIEDMLWRLYNKDGMHGTETLYDTLHETKPFREMPVTGSKEFEDDHGSICKCNVYANGCGNGFPRDEPEVESYPMQCHVIIVNGPNWNYLPLMKARCTSARYGSSGYARGFDSEKDYYESLYSSDDAVTADVWAAIHPDEPDEPTPIEVRRGGLSPEALDIAIQATKEGDCAMDRLMDRYNDQVFEPLDPADAYRPDPLMNNYVSRGIRGVISRWVETGPDKPVLVYHGSSHGTEKGIMPKPGAQRPLPDTSAIQTDPEPGIDPDIPWF